LSYNEGISSLSAGFGHAPSGRSSAWRRLSPDRILCSAYPPACVGIQQDVALSIDKSGTPNRHTLTSSGDFINPTEFHCLSGSYFKQEVNSNVEVKNGSTLIISGKYELNDGSVLRIRSGSCLQIKQGATLQISGSGAIMVENGAYLCVESGASIYLQHFNSAINLYESTILGRSPQSPASGACISSISGITKTGSGTINLLNQTVYIQNETITGNRYIVGKNIYIGKNVTSSKAQGDAVLATNANVFFVASENVHIQQGFECDPDATFEIKR
jgi:hypothetical protein